MGLAKELEDVPQALGAVLSNVASFDDLDRVIGQFAQAQDRMRDFMASIGGGQEMTQTEQAIVALRQQFALLERDAELLGIGIDEVRAAEAKRLAQMRDDLNSDLRQQILRISDPLQAALNDLDAWAEDLRTDARALGGNLGLVEQLVGQRRSAIIEQYNAPVLEAQRRAEEERLRVIEDGHRQEIQLIETQLRDEQRAREAAARDLDALRDAWVRGQQSVADTLFALETDIGRGASPTDALKAAEAQFNAVRTGALAGNADALANLGGAATRLLDVSAEVFGIGDAFTTRRGFVLDTLRNVGGSVTGTNDSPDVVARLEQQIAQADRNTATLDNRLAKVERLLDRVLDKGIAA